MKTTLSSILLLVLILGTGVRGYPPQERLMPDGAPVAAVAAVAEDATDHEDSVASASEVASDQYDDDDDDDSDMFMEPDGTGGVAIAAEAEGAVEGKGEGEVQADATKDQHPRNTELRIESRTSSSVEKSLESDSQNFFPSFAELFSNQRLPFTESQQQRYRPNRFLGYFQRDRGAYQASTTNAKDTQHPLLGSGNFGVIRGGTYYPEEKENEEYSADESLYNPYFTGGNGRARANYYRNPKPQPIRGGDFFANFRDFADITAPPKSSFSHLSVVYANKNGSATGRIVEPRNIIETLKMLEEEERVNGVASTTTELPTKKLSKGKRKLIKIKQYEEDKARRSRVPVEPLLALS